MVFDTFGAGDSPSTQARKGTRVKLSARLEPFDSLPRIYFPEDVTAYYPKYRTYYRRNYLKHFPQARNAAILCIASGPGYMVQLLNETGYKNVIGLDSNEDWQISASSRGLNWICDDAFGYLDRHPSAFDVIFTENEVNHLTKEEFIDFLQKCRHSLRENGVVLVTSQNGANFITGADACAHNIDHFAIYTEYSLRQMLSLTGFDPIEMFPLRLYVFYRNPLNYVGMAMDATINGIQRVLARFYAKRTRLFSKKIFAVGHKPSEGVS